MSTLRALLPLLIFTFLGCSQAAAEIVVVVDAKSGIERLTQEDVINIYLGRSRKLPTGTVAIPIDQPLADTLRADFYRALVDKNLSEINAYWARLYFSGKTKPPEQAKSAAEVLAHVVGVPGGIGYIDRSKIDDRVRIVLSLRP